MENLLTRLKHSLYLAPAVLLLLTWIIAAPSLVAGRFSMGYIIAFLVATALVMAWCITLFAHALLRDKP
jgi:hypothetical protein